MCISITLVWVLDSYISLSILNFQLSPRRNSILLCTKRNSNLFSSQCPFLSQWYHHLIWSRSNLGVNLDTALTPAQHITKNSSFYLFNISLMYSPLFFITGIFLVKGAIISYLGHWVLTCCSACHHFHRNPELQFKNKYLTMPLPLLFSSFSMIHFS